MSFSFFGGSKTEETPKETKGPNPLKTLENRLRAREEHMDICIEHFDKLIKQLKEEEKALSPVNYKKTEEVKETVKVVVESKEPQKVLKLPKKSEWHLTLNSVLKSIIDHTVADIKPIHDKLASLDLDHDAKDGNHVLSCRLSKQLAIEYKALLNDICIFLLECRTGEEVMKTLLPLFNITKADELFERALYKHIQKTTTEAEDHVSKGLRDMDKIRHLVEKQMEYHKTTRLTQDDEEATTLTLPQMNKR